MGHHHAESGESERTCQRGSKATGSFIQGDPKLGMNNFDSSSPTKQKEADPGLKKNEPRGKITRICQKRKELPERRT